MLLTCNHGNMLVLLILAVSIIGFLWLLLRSPRNRRRLQLGTRRPSNHALSLPNTPTRRALEMKHDTSSETTHGTHSPQNGPVVSTVAEAVASRWNAESRETRQVYLHLSEEEGDTRDRECMPSSIDQYPSTPSTASSFSTVHSIDYASSVALVVVDGALVSVPNEPGSTVRVTELGSPIAPAHAEFSTAYTYKDDTAQLDEDSLDPELWTALFDGIEPENPGQETLF